MKFFEHCQELLLLLCFTSFASKVEGYSEQNKHVQSLSYLVGNPKTAPSQYLQPGPVNTEDAQGSTHSVKSRKYVIRSFESVSDAQQHKCRIWIPSNSVSKYPYAEVIQRDDVKKLYSIEICCTGFRTIRLMGVTACLPICNCQNGSCRVPGECHCYEGFVMNDNGDCVFACPMGCQNGRCFLDGSCQCDAGYKLDKTRRFCRPICSSDCNNNPRLNCTEPETCSCAKGYHLRNEGCQPTCDPDCGIGGVCKENNQCDCGEGYALKDGVCQNDCYQKCDNGICVSRNRCICDAGFTYNEQSTMCVPV